MGVLFRRRAVGIWRALILAMACCSSSSLGQAKASDAGVSLEKARAALAKNNVAAAREAYGTIGPDTEVWVDRLEDTIRWQLLAKKPLEAWRLTELARRTRLSFDNLGYYRALAALQSRVCVLMLPVRPSAWHLLLEAHMYRFPTRYQSGSYSSDAYGEASGERLPHHIHGLQTHYLADIPSAVLLAGTGCRLFSRRFADRETAEALELETLEEWYFLTVRSGEAMDGREAVELRLVTLAAAADDLELQKTILARFLAFRIEDWVATSDPERRFVWQQLINSESIPPPPYAPGSHQTALVQAIILALETPDAAQWMGLLDFEALPSKDREALVRHLLTLKEIEHRPYLLLRQAQSFYEQGQMPAALGVIRQLLLMEAADGLENVETAAAGLAAQIFAEYRYDESMLGAIQASIPAATWGRIFRRLLCEYALTGNGAGFELIERSIATSKQSRAVRLSPQELSMLDAMAHRRGGAFDAVLTQWGKDRRLGGRIILFLAELGEIVLQLTPEERQAASGFLGRIGETLRLHLAQGQSQTRLLELMQIFSPATDDRYVKGSKSVREGTVAAGVVDLRRSSMLPYPFVWDTSPRLQLRDLLVQPVAAGDRAWQIR